MTPLSQAHAGARTQIPDAPLPAANHGARLALAVLAAFFAYLSLRRQRNVWSACFLQPRFVTKIKGLAQMYPGSVLGVVGRPALDE
jgi:hypothetical protein